MKAIQKERPFVPVILLLESQDDVDKIFSLLNHVDMAIAVELNGVLNPLEGMQSPNYRYYHKRLECLSRRGAIDKR